MSVAQIPLVNISIKGKDIPVPAYRVGQATVVVTGRFPRIASVHDENWLDVDHVTSPAQFVELLKLAEVPADIFTFSPRIPASSDDFDYPHEMVNFAVVPTGSYKTWWEDRLPQETRKHVRKAQKMGLILREVEFNHELIIGLKSIYDESPVRQGRRFWHYGKSPEVIRRENSSYIDRSILIAAFHGNEMVGLLKLVRTGNIAQVMQIVTKTAHAEKKTTNALIAKGVEACADRGIQYMVYGHYIYGKNATGQLTEFKRRNGFEMVLTPRYYIPLTAKGQIAVASGLHLGLRRFFPQALEKRLLDLRSRYYAARSRRSAAREAGAQAPQPANSR